MTATKPPKSIPSRSRAPAVLAIVAMVFLAFVGGAFVADFQSFPYRLIFAKPFEYLHALQEKHTTEKSARVEAMEQKEARVTVAAKPEAFDGYTFLTMAASRPSTAYLIDMNGKIVHEWHRPFREIWPKPPHKADPAPDDAIAWRYAELFPNGDVLTTIKAYGDTPDGYGLVKVDKDSRVLWSVADNFHHHFSIGADGRIYAAVHEWRNTQERPVPGIPPISRPILEDFVVVLSPDGKELSRVSLLDAMTVPEFRDYVSSSYVNGFDYKKWDPLHTNDVEIIDDAFAAHHPFMKAGMVMVSLRDLDALIVLDLAERRVVWAARGPWVRQHDPDLLDDGTVLVFDNRGDNVKGGGSRIIEYDPSSQRIVWSYAGNEASPFFTETGGGQERLPNGNTLISEDNAGRVFEVTRAGQIVWEYRGNRMYHATRVAKDWLKFEPKGALTPRQTGTDRVEH